MIEQTAKQYLNQIILLDDEKYKIEQQIKELNKKLDYIRSEYAKFSTFFVKNPQSRVNTVFGKGVLVGTKLIKHKGDPFSFSSDALNDFEVIELEPF